MASDSRNQSPYFADGANTAACFILGGVFHHPRLEQAGGNRRAIMHQFDLKRTERAIERDLARGSLGDAGEENAVQSSRKSLNGWSQLLRYVTTAFSSPRYRHRPERDDTTGTRGRLQSDAVAFWRKFVYLNRWRVRVLRILVLFLVRLIYYPMIVLSLLILARNTAFDNWALTPALLIVYCIFVSVNGAFARFSQQSLVRSVLLKIGSVGGTSLLELSALMNF